MSVNIYDKLKSINEVEDYKDFLDLYYIRAIRINDLPINDPIYEVHDNDRIQIGIKILD